jgi:HEAT repeat protein
MTPPVTSAGGSQTTTPSPAGAASAGALSPVITQMLQGATPAERHAAIRQLVRFDWQKNPVVASALLAGAKGDPAPVVRVDCLRHLAAYQMTHPQVLAELAAMTQDADSWVRDEAAKALAQLKQTP